MKKLSLLSLLASISVVFLMGAASSPLNNDDSLTADFHQGRRDALRAIMPQNSVAVFFCQSRSKSF
jgi:Xaa-Pro aminopeptidase